MKRRGRKSRRFWVVTLGQIPSVLILPLHIPQRFAMFQKIETLETLGGFRTRNQIPRCRRLGSETSKIPQGEKERVSRRRNFLPGSACRADKPISERGRQSRNSAHTPSIHPTGTMPLPDKQNLTSGQDGAKRTRSRSSRPGNPQSPPFVLNLLSENQF